MALRENDFGTATDEELDEDALESDVDVTEAELDEEEEDASAGLEDEPDLLEQQLLRKRTRADLDGIAADDTVSLYLKQMGQVALLTAEEEVMLAKRIEAGVSACKKLRATTLTENQRDDLEQVVRLG